MSLPENHFSIVSAQEVQKICQPFFKETGLTFFSYSRIYESEEILSLTTNANWQKNYYEKGYFKDSASISSRLVKGKHLLNSNPFLSEMLSDLKNNFGVDNRFEIVDKVDNYFELCRFGGNTDDNTVLELYQNKTYLLDKFRIEFLNNAQKLINEANKPQNLIDLKNLR